MKVGNVSKETMDYDRIVTAEDIESEFGFVLSQALPVDRHGDVPRIAVFQELNPFAPEEIYCSVVVRKGAETLVETGKPTRVFVRLQQNRWADCGMYQAVRLDTNASSTRKASDLTGRWKREEHGPIWGILHLERASNV
jgi:hypothetical protein